MKKRQTYSQPNIEGINYALLEQKGEDDFYRLSGRDKTTNELITALGSAEEIEKRFGKDIISTPVIVKITSNENIPEKIEYTPEYTANKIEEIYNRLKQKKPFTSIIDIYKDSEGWNVITQALDGKRQDAAIFFQEVSNILSSKSLKLTRPSYDYFLNKDRSSTVWLNIEQIGKDIVKEQAIEERAEICFKKLIKVYEKMKLDNESSDNFDVYSNDEGRAALLEAVEGTGDALESIFSILKIKLNNFGLNFNRPSSSYLLEKSSSYRFTISKK